MNIDKLTSLDQLRDEQRELAEIIGLEAYKKLVAHYSGSFLYICKVDTVLKESRDNEIRQRFNGCNYGELAREYNLAEATVRDIVAEKRRQLREEPLEGQMSFAEE